MTEMVLGYERMRKVTNGKKILWLEQLNTRVTIYCVGKNCNFAYTVPGR